MPDHDPDEQPSLELPKLGLRRRRRAKQAAPEPPEPPGPPEPPEPLVSGEQATVLTTETVADAPPAAPAPVSGEQATVLTTETVADAPPAAPAPVSGEQATVVVTETVADAPPDTAAPADPPASEAPPARRRRELKLRRPGGWPAVVATGLIVGLAVVGLTWSSLQTCQEVQGTPSCGKSGYPMLGVVLAVSVVVGGVLLRLARVRDPVSTSFLGVGLAAVIALLFLVDHLDEPAMVVVVPLIMAATFGTAHWVTKTFIEPGDQPR